MGKKVLKVSPSTAIKSLEDYNNKVVRLLCFLKNLTQNDLVQNPFKEMLETHINQIEEFYN